MASTIDEEEIIILYAHGLSVAEVAEQVGCHHEAVRGILMEVAFPPHPDRRLDGVDWDAVVEDYQEGYELTVPELCRKHLIKRTDLNEYLKRRPDIKKREPGRGRTRTRALYGPVAKALPDPRFDAVVRAYEEGMTVKDLLIVYSVGSTRLYRELAVRDVPFRARREGKVRLSPPGES